MIIHFLMLQNVVQRLSNKYLIFQDKWYQATIAQGRNIDKIMDPEIMNIRTWEQSAPENAEKF